MQGKVIRLVLHSPSQDTIAALEDLLVEARAGRVVGLAYVAMHKVYEYTVDVTGECKSSPTLTRGMLSTLDDELRDSTGKRS